MVSWLIVAAEVAAMCAIFFLLDGKKAEKKVLLVFSILSVGLGCLALYLAPEQSTLMRALCFAVTLSSVMRLDRIRQVRRK